MPGVVAVCLPAPKAEPPDPNPNPTRYVSDQCFDQEHGGGVQSTICMPACAIRSRLKNRFERREERREREERGVLGLYCGLFAGESLLLCTPSRVPRIAVTGKYYISGLYTSTCGLRVMTKTLQNTGTARSIRVFYDAPARLSVH